MQIEPGYESLAAVLQEALDQSQYGKGRVRHANGKPFTEQPIMDIARRKGRAFLEGQVEKKALELDSEDLQEPAARKRELLSIIVYAAAAVLLINERIESQQLTEQPPEQVTEQAPNKSGINQFRGVKEGCTNPSGPCRGPCEDEMMVCSYYRRVGVK